MSARLSRTSPTRAGSKIGLMFVPKRAVDSVHELQQVERLAAGDVDRAADRSRRVGGQQVAVDDVVDVREVARLLAVAEDRRPPAGQHFGDELRDHGRVLALRILPRAEDVEVADRHRFQAVGRR